MNTFAAPCVLITTLTFAMSCASPKVGQTSATVTTNVVEHMVADSSAAVWRAAVVNHTRSLVDAGTRDLDLIRVRVCEDTAAEEADARKANQKWAKLLGTTTSAAALEHSGIDPELLKDMNAGVEQATVEMLDREFTRSRDRLIERVYAEAIQQAPER